MQTLTFDEFYRMNKMNHSEPQHFIWVGWEATSTTPGRLVAFANMGPRTQLTKHSCPALVIPTASKNLRISQNACRHLKNHEVLQLNTRWLCSSSKSSLKEVWFYSHGHSLISAPASRFTGELALPKVHRPVRFIGLARLRTRNRSVRRSGTQGVCGQGKAFLGNRKSLRVAPGDLTRKLQERHITSRY